MPAENASVTVTYLKDTSQTKKLSYRVEHWVDGVMRNYRTIKKTVWINDSDTLTVTGSSIAKREYLGYEFDHINPAIIAGDKVANGDVIRLYYKAPETPGMGGGTLADPTTNAPEKSDQLRLANTGVNLWDIITVSFIGIGTGLRRILRK